MVKFKIPIKDLLGRAYYHYKLGNDITNGTKGQTNVVHCTVTNVFGNPVSNKDVTLYAQGVEVSTKTTNALGYVEWEIPLDNASLRLYTVDNQTTYTIVKNGGWNTYTPSLNSYTTLYYNEDTRTIEFHYYRTNYNFTSTSEITLHSGLIPSAYRPKTNIICAIYDVRNVGAVKSNGDVCVTTTTSGSGRIINMSAMWHY